MALIFKICNTLIYLYTLAENNMIKKDSISQFTNFNCGKFELMFIIPNTCQ